MKPNESLEYFEKLEAEMMDLLSQWVRMESPTTDKESVDRFGKAVAGKLAEIGMLVEFREQSARGNHILARWKNDGPKVLLIGHLDTVWELGALERMPLRVEGDVAYGPGIYDMKGSLIVTLFALRLLYEQGLHRNNLTLLLNSDEEEGSGTSRELVESEASNAQCALILEPGGPNNSVKTKRRGVGRYKVTAKGRPAHAGVEPEKGINAVAELSYQILEIQSWNGLHRGISANVGLIRGGTRSNVIPAEAEAVIDVRCDAPEDAAWLEERFKTLQAKHPEARLSIEGGFERPPLVRSEKVLSLFNEAKEIAEQFGYPITEYWTGGASDGNFTAALGVPTLDGLGPEGDGAHAAHEHIVVSSLPKRANLLHHLIRRKISPQRH